MRADAGRAWQASLASLVVFASICALAACGSNTTGGATARPSSTTSPLIPTTTVPPSPLPPPPPPPNPCPGAIDWTAAASSEGSPVTLKGPVADTKFASDSSGEPTFLDVGAPYPDPSRLTIVIWIENRFGFNPPPEIQFAGKTICVSGVPQDYRGSPEVIVSSPAQIKTVS
jgi:hypothetical protein